MIRLKQAIGECWLIDKEYIIDENFEWVPSNFEKDYIHMFGKNQPITQKQYEGIGGIIRCAMTGKMQKQKYTEFEKCF